MRLALYQPDIPQNTGTLMRFCACLGVPLDIIEPCGFMLDDRRVRRAHMDYLEHLDYTRHNNWQIFQTTQPQGRRILMTTKSSIAYTYFKFQPDDILIAGRESAGVPDDVHHSVDAHVVIPMVKDVRSINVAMSCAMILGEALRQTRQQ